MEDVLEVYQRPANPEQPLVCLDEFAKQLLSEIRDPQAATPNHVARYDAEYIREGSISGFMIASIHEGTRDVFISEMGRRTSSDYAHCIKHLADVIHPEAKKIVLVMDNLNTHTETSLYKTFEPAEARRLCERFEIHHTPKHGSWLNMAEIEIGMLTRTCLDRRIESAEKMRSETKAYLKRKNAMPSPIKWQFKNEDARTKLKNLYPTI